MTRRAPRARHKSGRPARLAKGLGAAAAVAATLGAGWLAFELLRLPSAATIARLERERVTSTALMRARAQASERAGRRFGPRLYWVESGDISPHLKAAVLASEDARFFEHPGIDFAEIQAALEQAGAGRRLRGASTITQQLVKNLYLSDERSLLRKVQEVLLAGRAEAVLSKDRILTLYLNVAEWGHGAFGAEAAARVWFGTSARRLSLAQAAALAAMLPNPRQINPARPAVLRPRALRVLRRMEEERAASRAEIEAAREEIEGWLGGGRGLGP